MSMATSQSRNTGEGGVFSIEGESSDSESDENETEKIVDGLDNSLSGYLLARDRVRRQTKPPAIFESGDFVAYALTSAADMEINEPKTYAEAMGIKDRDKWNASMGEEKDSLDENETWDIVDRPQRQRVIGCKVALQV